ARRIHTGRAVLGPKRLGLGVRAGDLGEAPPVPDAERGGGTGPRAAVTAVGGAGHPAPGAAVLDAEAARALSPGPRPGGRAAVAAVVGADHPDPGDEVLDAEVVRLVAPEPGLGDGALVAGDVDQVGHLLAAALLHVDVQVLVEDRLEAPVLVLVAGGLQLGAV